MSVSAFGSGTAGRRWSVPAVHTAETIYSLYNVWTMCAAHNLQAVRGRAAGVDSHSDRRRDSPADRLPEVAGA